MPCVFWEMATDECCVVNEQHIDPDFSLVLSTAIKHQSKEDQFTDVTIEVDGTIFKSHRFILSAMSGFFKGLFTSGMKESKEQHVRLEGISSDTFRLILESIFESKNVLTPNNYINLWKAFDMLHIISLKEQCEAFVMKNITIQNCFSIHELAVQLNSKPVEHFSFIFFLNNFDEFSTQNSDFLQLKVEDIKSVIRNDSLCTFSENNVVNFILKWVTYRPVTSHRSEMDLESVGKHYHIEDIGSTEPHKDIQTQTGGKTDNVIDCYPRAKWLPELLSLCRILLTTDTFLLDLLVTDCLIQSILKAAEFVEKCVKLKLLGSYKYNMSSIWSIHRLSGRTQSAFLYFRDACNLRAGLLEDSASATFHQSSSCVTKFDKTVHAAAVINDQILALTADGVLYSKFLYNQSSFEILTKKTKDSRSIIVVDNKLYQVGARIEPAVIRVHYLVIHSLSLEEPLINVENIRLAAHRSSIMIFGSEKDVPNTTIVQRFDTHTGQSYRLCDVPGTASGLVTFQNYEETFFLFSDGELWRLRDKDGGNNDVMESQYVAKLWSPQQRQLEIYGALIVNDTLLVYSEGRADQTATEHWAVSVGGAFTSVVYKQLVKGVKCCHFLKTCLPAELCNSLKKSK